MADQRKDRPWDRTPQAAEYRNAYRREHYRTVAANVHKATADAYRARCKELGISPSAPLKKAIEDVLEGRYNP